MEQKEIINGKPHFGIWRGYYITLIPAAFEQQLGTGGVLDKQSEWMLDNERRYMEQLGLEVRDERVIARPPMRPISLKYLDVNPFDPISQYGTLAIKYLAWGRAFRIMRLLKKNKTRYKKCMVSGRRRLRKI